MYQNKNVFKKMVSALRIQSYKAQESYQELILSNLKIIAIKILMTNYYYFIFSLETLSSTVSRTIYKKHFLQPRNE